MDKSKLPNIITILRIALIPVFIVFFILKDFWPAAITIALIMFIALAATDFLDGFLARKFNTVTDLGKLLDPAADKILVIIALILLASTGTVEKLSLKSENQLVVPICIALIFAREFMITLLRQVAVSKDIVIPASILGKIKTVVTYVAIGFGLGAEHYVYFLEARAKLFQGTKNNLAMKKLEKLYEASGAYNVLAWISLSILIIATIITVASGIDYVIRNRAVFKGGFARFTKNASFQTNTNQQMPSQDNDFSDVGTASTKKSKTAEQTYAPSPSAGTQASGFLVGDFDIVEVDDVVEIMSKK